MRRVVGILLTVLMTLGVYYVGLQQETKIETSEIIDTVEIKYLTDADFSRLYSLKDETIGKDLIELTQSEAQLLMMVGRSEGGDTLEGQLWTMRTLLNRVESNEPDFKKLSTIGEVVFQDGQFQVVSTGAYKKADVNPYSHIALAMIEGGWDETDGALWFEASTNSSNSWHCKNLTLVKEVAGQRYYK